MQHDQWLEEHYGWVSAPDPLDPFPCCGHCGCPEGHRFGHPDSCDQGCDDDLIKAMAGAE